MGILWYLKAIGPSLLSYIIPSAPAPFLSRVNYTNYHHTQDVSTHALLTVVNPKFLITEITHLKAYVSMTHCHDLQITAGRARLAQESCSVALEKLHGLKSLMKEDGRHRSSLKIPSCLLVI